MTKFLAENNPFRWKAHWYDVDAGLYFANGRVYSPYLLQYLDASDPETLLSVVSTPNSLDRNAITLDNSITYEANSHTIFPSGEMFAEDPIDQNEGKSWWDLHWQKAIQWIAFGVMLILSVVLLIIPGTQAIGAAMLYAGAKAAISGLIIGAIVGGISAAINKSNVWEGILEGGVYGAINGFTTGAIMGFFQGLSQVVSKSVNAVDKCAPSSGQCFIAGTLVACLTAEGNETQKPIEEVQVGDKVLAYDEDTGEQAYKAVKRLFRNETKEWHHIFVGNEEIVCTGGHPFFVLNAETDRNTIHFEGKSESKLGKWIAAKDLQVGDLLLQGNGSQVRVGSITIETLEDPETTYNFEVEGLHTYYVGKLNILTHNKCIFEELGVKDFNEVGSKYTPDELINKLDDLGYSKSVSLKNPSSPATMMSNGKYTFRIQAVNPQHGTSYFRVSNQFGNYLDAFGQFPSSASTADLRQLTHFYFGG